MPDAWLLRRGFAIATLGWQWDAVGDDALKLHAPIAQDHGQRITGLLRGDFMPSHAMDDVPLGHLINGTTGSTARVPNTSCRGSSSRTPRTSTGAARRR